MEARSRLRDSVSLRDGCDTGAVAPDYGVGQLSAAIHCPATERPLASMSPRCDALRLAHCPSRQIRTIQGFLSTRGSGPAMIAVLQKERSSLRWRLSTREYNVTKRKESAATPAILPSWNGWRSGSKAGRSGTCQPACRLPFKFVSKRRSPTRALTS